MSVTLNQYDDQQISTISRLFSPTLIRELAKKGNSPMFARISLQSPFINIDSKQPVSAFFDTAFDLLKKKNNRDEYIYKSAITQNILLGIHSLKTAVLLNEFRVCNNKADSVILNGTSTVYEIKSERDNLSRLEQQISSYKKVFANVYVIIGENHLQAVLDTIPKEVGIRILKDSHPKYQISNYRDAIDSHEKTNPESIFNSIQLKEVKKILKINGYEIPDLPNTRMNQALKELFTHLTPKQAHDGMVSVLKFTRSHIPLRELINSVPKSLQAVMLSTSIRKQDHNKIIRALNTPMHEALKWN